MLSPEINPVSVTTLVQKYVCDAEVSPIRSDDERAAHVRSMRVFLSYSSDKVDLAKRIAYALKDEGDDVFFDRDSLPVGETYDRRIREAIQAAEVFIFLISPKAISSGCYALAELDIAGRASAGLGMKVLPVMVSQTDFESMPPYLRSLTVLQPRGDILAETLAVVADIRLELKRERVSVSVTVANSGWILNFFVIGERPRELFFRFGDEADFKSTGLTRVPDSTTGLPLPRLQTTVAPFTGSRDLFVKYVDARGREHGPYPLVVDAVRSVIASAQEALEITRPWVSFREFDGRMLAYFTHLLSFKNALKEIQYSVDNDTLSSRIHFTPPRHPGETEISEGDEIMVEIPPTAGYVCVKLVFIDGTEWPPERFNRVL